MRRLREVKRNPTTLWYATSRTIPYLERVEDTLTTELGVTIRIRDRRYFVNQTNNSPQTVQAFDSYLAPSLQFLTRIGGNTFLREAPNLPARALCVFLGQEADNRSGKSELMEAVTDSLILWALEDTDPEVGRFMNRDEILEKIVSALPTSTQFIKSVIDTRLGSLASKKNTGGRQIRWHKKDGKYCLPYETRMLVQEENTVDAALKTRVTEVFELRAADICADEGITASAKQVGDICHHALELTFESQGLEVAHFVSGESETGEPSFTIDDKVTAALDKSTVAARDRQTVKNVSLTVLRKTFYDSTPDERVYLGKLSRTYCLLFTLRTEPRVVEYFRNMSAEFVLYVGADLIVRALSEHYLAPEDQMTANLFRILAAAGSKLILSDVVLDEVCSHLRVTDNEFRNTYAKFENEVTRDVARHISHILIRAYFYTKLGGAKGTRTPRTWSQYLQQFVDFGNLHREEGRHSLRAYLCEAFSFEFETRTEMLKHIDPNEVEQLKNRLIQARPKGGGYEVRAYNDALHVYRVYERRRQLREHSKPNPYGYKTWWLTRETAIVSTTRSLVNERGAPYIIRPEFLLNFIALAPSLEDVRKTYRAIFPTLLGVRLSNRMKDSAFRAIMERIGQVNDLSEPRARAMVASLSNQVKADLYKDYEFNVGNSLDRAIALLE